MKHVVVISHRYHYHICQVAIDFIRKQYNPDKFTILFDDVKGTKRGWDDAGRQLVRTVAEKYGFKDNYVTAHGFSIVNNVHAEKRGWLRQQYVKLNLHNFLDGDEWLVVDGDTLINAPIDPWKYQYINHGDRDPLPYHYYDFFTRYILDLEDKRPYFDGSPVGFMAMPVNLLTRKTLAGLESYIFDLHGTDIKGVLDSFTLKKDKEKYVELSEYSIIGNYRYFISKDMPEMRYVNLSVEQGHDFVRNWQNRDIAVLDGKDNLPIEWYQQMGVTINKDVWDANGY